MISTIPSVTFKTEDIKWVFETLRNNETYHHDDDESDGTVQAAACVFGNFLARRPFVNIAVLIDWLIASSQYSDSLSVRSACVAAVAAIYAIGPPNRRERFTSAFAHLLNEAIIIHRYLTECAINKQVGISLREMA